MDLAGHSLNIQDGLTNNFIVINPQGFLGGIETSDGTAESDMILNADLAGNNVKWRIYSNDGVNESYIEGDAQESSIEYESATNEFTGKVGIGIPPTVLFQGVGSNINWQFDDGGNLVRVAANNIQLISSSMSIGMDGTAQNIFIGADETNIIIDNNANAVIYNSNTHTFNGNVVATSLSTTGSPPTPSGTIKMVITDDNGQLSFEDVPVPNLIVDSLGTSGTDLIVPRNDTLFGRLLRGQVFITVDTLSGGEARVRLDTSSAALKAYIVAQVGSGITTLNTLTASTQTFAVGTSGSDFNISSATSTHTFNIPDASNSNRGLVTTGAQTFAGVKTLNSLPFFTAGFATSATVANANLYVGTGQTGTTSSTSRNLFAGAASIGARVIQSGSTNYTVLANNSYAHMVLGNQDITEAASGTHALLGGLVVFPPNITGGVATVTNTATLYITGAPSATVTGGNYAIMVNAGDANFVNGNITLGTAGNKLNITTGSNASIGVSSALSSGTLTVSTTAVTASSKIFLTHAGSSITNAGVLYVGTIVAGTSFQIKSTNASDNDTVNWWIIN